MGFQRRPAVLSRRQDDEGAGHPGVRSSLINSLPSISSGSRSLDMLVQHGGLPRGTLTLVEEHGTTDFASSLLKSFCAQGIADARSGAPSAVICVGFPEWLRSLPGINTGPISKRSAPGREATSEFKIAWRYQKLAPQVPVEGVSPEGSETYCRDLNFRANLVPAAQVGSEAFYVSGSSLSQLISELRSTLQVLNRKVVRIVVPSLLHPALYSPESSIPAQIVPFFHHLRLLSREFKATTLVSIPLAIYPRNLSVVATIERVVDTCLELEPFDVASAAGASDDQGLIHLHKLADISNRGLCVQRMHEYAFKLGRAQFEVAPFGIPVEEVAGPANNDNNASTEVY